MAAAVEAIEIEGVRVSNPDKVLYPEQGTTKRDLANYYLAVAEWILPHVAGRPLTLVRCPAGRQKKCFYQRHVGSGIPAELGRVDIPGFDEVGAYLFIKDLRGLLAAVQMGVLELHPWGARVDRPDRPDRVIFDLDPGEGVAFADVVSAAREIRGRLGDLGLVSFPKTTGGKGMHVVVPIDRRHAWPQVKAFARHLAEAMAADAPHRFLNRISKQERRCRIFIDYLRNDPTSTAVAPYSPRARPHAPVATPLAWEEVCASFDPAAFTIATVPARVRWMRNDPWRHMADVRQALPRAAASGRVRHRRDRRVIPNAPG